MNTTTLEQPALQTRKTSGEALDLKKILVPLDFSRASMHALKYTIPLAEEFHAAIHLVHVQPADEFTTIPGAGRLMLNCADAIALMQDRLSEVQEKHDVRFWPDNCHIVSGRPYEEICKLAVELEMDLIVLPTRGHSGLKHLALGSTAERVVRHAPCPVLVPRGSGFEHLTWSGELDEKFSIRKILVPLDFSAASLAGAKYAALLAKRFNAKLNLFHVIFPYTQIFQMDRYGGDLLPLVQNAKVEAENQLDKIRQLEFMDGVECECAIRTGSTIDEICVESAKPDIDLLVTSTHGRTGFSHAMIGSVAEHVIRYSGAPVLVVPSRGYE